MCAEGERKGKKRDPKSKKYSKDSKRAKTAQAVSHNIVIPSGDGKCQVILSNICTCIKIQHVSNETVLLCPELTILAQTLHSFGTSCKEKCYYCFVGIYNNSQTLF